MLSARVWAVVNAASWVVVRPLKLAVGMAPMAAELIALIWVVLSTATCSYDQVLICEDDKTATSLVFNAAICAVSICAVWSVVKALIWLGVRAAICAVFRATMASVDRDAMAADDRATI